MEQVIQCASHWSFGVLLACFCLASMHDRTVSGKECLVKKLAMLALGFPGRERLV